MITVAVRNKDGSKELFRCEAAPYEEVVAAVKEYSPDARVTLATVRK